MAKITDMDDIQETYAIAYANKDAAGFSTLNLGLWQNSEIIFSIRNQVFLRN